MSKQIFRVYIVLLVMCFCFAPAYSQTKAQRKAFLADSARIVRVKLVRPQFRIDNRNIFVKGQVITINGTGGLHIGNDAR